MGQVAKKRFLAKALFAIFCTLAAGSSPQVPVVLPSGPCGHQASNWGGWGSPSDKAKFFASIYFTLKFHVVQFFYDPPRGQVVKECFLAKALFAIFPWLLGPPLAAGSSSGCWILHWLLGPPLRWSLWTPSLQLGRLGLTK